MSHRTHLTSTEATLDTPVLKNLSGALPHSSIQGMPLLAILLTLNPVSYLPQDLYFPLPSQTTVVSCPTASPSPDKQIPFLPKVARLVPLAWPSADMYALKVLPSTPVSFEAVFTQVSSLGNLGASCKLNIFSTLLQISAQVRGGPRNKQDEVAFLSSSKLGYQTASLPTQTWTIKYRDEMEGKDVERTI